MPRSIIYFTLFVSLVAAITIPCQAQSVQSAVQSTTIVFTNPAVGFQADIEGLLQCPTTPGKHPLVVFVHGSGQGTRFEYNNLFPLFLNNGFAVFSYDKRGVNKSGGTYNGVGPKNSPMMIPLLASDAYEGIEAVKNRPEIDSSSVVLFGASQAGWIIPGVASMSKSVSNFVIIYGPTVVYCRLNRWRQRQRRNKRRVGREGSGRRYLCPRRYGDYLQYHVSRLCHGRQCRNWIKWRRPSRWCGRRRHLQSR